MTENENQQNITLDVNFPIAWRDGDKSLKGVVTQIKRTGCYVKSPDYSKEGTEAEFKIQMDSGHWISVPGVIFKSFYPQGFVVKFTNITEYTKLLLSQFVFFGKKESAANVGEERSPRIIIADDDLTILKTLSATIKKLDYTPVAFSDGLQVYNKLKEDTDFAAAIFDMIMPNLEGLDLIRFMKNDPKMKNIPIGIITAEEDPRYWDESIASGADVFLPKPFNAQQIKMMIKMLFRKKVAKENTNPNA